MEQYINAAMAAIQKFIEAATPVAIKAYEIGLMTLQVDAASQLIPALLVCPFMIWLTYRIYKWDILEKKTAHEISGIFTCFGGASCVGLFIWQATVLLNIWLWVKLFKPELWLVHAAIEKVMK